MLYVLYIRLFFFFFKQKTAYEMRISDWSSDVCSSDLFWKARCSVSSGMVEDAACLWISPDWVLSNVPALSIMPAVVVFSAVICSSTSFGLVSAWATVTAVRSAETVVVDARSTPFTSRSEERTSELQALTRLW